MFRLYLPGSPTGHSYIVTDIYIQKRRRNPTFARSVFQGLRMPTSQERATQKAHADMYTTYFPNDGKYARIYTPTGRTGCYLLFRLVKSCEVLKHERQTHVNVFSINITHKLHAHPWTFCGNAQRKYTKKILINNKQKVFYPYNL